MPRLMPVDLSARTFTDVSRVLGYEKRQRFMRQLSHQANGFCIACLAPVPERANQERRPTFADFDIDLLLTRCEPVLHSPLVQWLEPFAAPHLDASLSIGRDDEESVVVAHHEFRC